MVEEAPEQEGRKVTGKTKIYLLARTKLLFIIIKAGRLYLKFFIKKKEIKMVQHDSRKMYKLWKSCLRLF